MGAVQASCVNAVIPAMQALYRAAERSSQGSDRDGEYVLSRFQAQLRKTPGWSSRELHRYIPEARREAARRACRRAGIPDDHRLVTSCCVHSARALYNRPFLFFQSCPKKAALIDDLVTEAVRNAVMGFSVPSEQVQDESDVSDLEDADVSEDEAEEADDVQEAEDADDVQEEEVQEEAEDADDVQEAVETEEEEEEAQEKEEEAQEEAAQEEEAEKEEAHEAEEAQEAEKEEAQEGDPTDEGGEDEESKEDDDDWGYVAKVLEECMNTTTEVKSICIGKAIADRSPESPLRIVKIDSMPPRTEPPAAVALKTKQTKHRRVFTARNRESFFT